MGGRELASASRDWTEVRLLGPLRVRRADGAAVDDRDWRTGKNADLLRWLALQAGDPVAVEVLAEGLWPGTGDARARGSLRTAVAQLRRVLGADSVERVAAGLVLKDCWVDASTFLELNEDMGRARREGRAAEALAVAREADALYVADVPLGEGVPEAIAEAATSLAAVHRRLLGDAAEAAVELGLMHDAVEFGTRLLEVDAVSERASRAIMLGYAGMGEVHHALQEFERCRHTLAEELGVDPSPQTREVHLQVLRPAPAPVVTPDLVGRHSELTWLEAVLREVPRPSAQGPEAGAGRADIVLYGRDGSGRRRLVREACRLTGLPLHEVATWPDSSTSTGQDRVLLWQPAAPWDLERLGRVLAGDVVGPGAVVVLLPFPGEVPALDALPRSPHVRCLELEALLPEDVQELATAVLRTRPLPSLLEELLALSGGLPGRVLDVLGEWSRGGRLVATSTGLALTASSTLGQDDPSGRRALARVLPRLQGDALEALQLAAVLDLPLTPSLLAPLLADEEVHGGSAAAQRARATAALEQLVDLALLRSSPAGAVWRHPLLRDAVYAWMRPAAQQRLHRRVAGLAQISSVERIGHWLRAGERELACVAALEAAGECSARGDHAGARTHLLEVCSLGDLPEAESSDRVDLFELLGDACALLRRPDEAHVAYRQALDIALEALLPEAPRLRRKLEGTADRRILEMAPLHGSSDASSVLAGLGVPSPGHPDAALEATLRDAADQADRRRDHRAAVRARLQMAAAVRLPRREFRAVHELVEQTLRLAPRPEERLRGVLVRHAAAVLLGGARTALEPLEIASRAAEAAGEEALSWRLLGLRVLVAHDLGDVGFEPLWRRLSDRVLTGKVDDLVPELAIVGLRVLVEREEYDLAGTMSAHLPVAGGQSSLLMQHLARLASADLAAGLGEHRRAGDLLRSVLDTGRATGCTLLVPEAAARLVVLEAAHDPSAARIAFDVFDDVVGAALGGPREECWRRLARAAVRAAHDDAAGAADACAQASTLAGKHGLQMLAAQARRLRAEHLRNSPERLAVVPPAPEQRDEHTA